MQQLADDTALLVSLQITYISLGIDLTFWTD